jgi:outer membrane protein TolC
MRIFFLTILFSFNSFATELTLDDFLKQITEKNQMVNASKFSVQAVEKRKNEKKLLFTPSVFAQAQTSADKKQTQIISMMGDETDYTMISTGIMQQFDFGLKGKLSYTLSQTTINHAIALPLPQYNETALGLELSQSLWRNFWGSESKSQADLIEGQTEIQKYTENYKVKNIMAKAEVLYWSLSQMRKIVTVQKNNLERALKIKSWAQNRLNSGLGEKSDFLQADANVKFREFELKSTLQDEKNLQRTFNSLRSIDSDQVTEELMIVTNNQIQSLVPPKREGLRDDTKIAQQVQKVSSANAQLSIERNKPTLEVYGTYILNGRDLTRTKSIENAFSKDYSTEAIGVRFNTPIDFFNLNNNIDGYKQDQIAAELNFKQKLFDELQEWNDLNAKFEDTKTKLVLTEKIVEAQKTKVINERERLTKGRTVTFQVLNFEQDYAQSELLKIKSETDLLNIYTQLKLFASGDKL